MLASTLFLPHKTTLNLFPSIHYHPRAKPLLSAFRVAAAAPNISIPSFETKSSPPITFYQLLHINHNASQTEIKAAYRSLAKLYHPDASTSDPNGGHFMQIHNAYATLSDPITRANYDLSIGATSAHCHLRYSASNNISGFRSTRRWETDQCW